ncbi:MAG: TIGR03560 family F420-dependent LLM class oxidoreductase [Actinomycetota bacterium]
MRICLMVEGQEGVTWQDWIGLARACEESGLEGLFRSDHYVSTINETTLGSLDAWATICGLASLTGRIRLGTMVSPATFRHPSLLAKMVTTADHISNGRVELGMGGGWFLEEHSAYGFDFPPAGERLEILAEQLEIIHGQWSEEVFSFDGANYSLEGVHALPKPVQRPHPPLIIGGSGGPKSLALAARWADEYNTVFPTVEQARARRSALDGALRSAGRVPGDYTFSLMTTCIVGRDRAELEQRVRDALKRTEDDTSVDGYLAEASNQRLVGTTEQVAARLNEYSEAGIGRVMLQHLNHRDLDMVRLIGSDLLPACS